MSSTRSFSLFWAICILLFAAGCDSNGSGDSSETFRFFDELDLVDDPSLRHDPDNGIHLTFLEPLEAADLTDPSQQIAVAVEEEASNTVLESVGLDVSPAIDGLDHHIYDVPEAGRYSLSFFMMNEANEESNPYPIVAIANVDTEEIVAAARDEGGVSPVFDLPAGEHIAIIFTEKFLDDALSEEAGLKEESVEGCNSDPFLCVQQVLDDTMNIVWAMDEQAQFIMDSTDDAPVVAEKASRVIELEQEALPMVIFDRIESYREAYSDTFGLPILQVAIEGFNLPGCTNPDDILSCDSNGQPVCGPFGSQPSCSQGIPDCQEGGPICAAGLDPPISAVTLTPVDNSSDLNNGLDEFSSEELDIVQSCIQKINTIN